MREIYIFIGKESGIWISWFEKWKRGHWQRRTESASRCHSYNGFR